MFKATILFSATGKTEDETIEKILFDMSEVIRNEGTSIKIEKVEEIEE